jgi:maltose O-acetyltransferase
MDGEWTAVTIRDGAAIGAGAIIMAGVTVGHDSVVGAGAIVTKDVQSGSRVMGNPASQRRFRLCEEMLC